MRVAKAIDAEFANSPYETKTETESAFAAGWVKQFGNIEFLILSIGAVVFFTLLLVTGNTMAISVRERTLNSRSSKPSAYSDRAVLFFVLAESMVIALIGGAARSAAGLVAVPGLGEGSQRLAARRWFFRNVDACGLGLVVACWSALISGIVPGIRRDAHARC